MGMDDTPAGLKCLLESVSKELNFNGLNGKRGEIYARLAGAEDNKLTAAIFNFVNVYKEGIKGFTPISPSDGVLLPNQFFNPELPN